MNQSGREAASRPDTSVRSTVSFTVQAGAAPSSTASRRSTVCPTMWRKAMPLPAGDQVGANEAPSSVSRSSSRPFRASRITTSVPSAVVRVAAT